jgi:hypothetical protein
VCRRPRAPDGSTQNHRRRCPGLMPSAPVHGASRLDATAGPAAGRGCPARIFGHRLGRAKTPAWTCTGASRRLPMAACSVARRRALLGCHRGRTVLGNLREGRRQRYGTLAHGPGSAAATMRGRARALRRAHCRPTNVSWRAGNGRCNLRPGGRCGQSARSRTLREHSCRHTERPAEMRRNTITLLTCEDETTKDTEGRGETVVSALENR